MLDAAKFAEEFVTHVRQCPSGIVACSGCAAFESWFLVELAQMMSASNRFDTIRFSYNYPESRGKADLMAEIREHRIVFELKCFVLGADSNKLKAWPEQIERLSHLLRDGHTRQCVAISTFSRYKREKLAGLLKSFHPLPWKVAGPYKFFESEDAPLQLVVATVNTEQVGIGA
ncbi:MAG: hypothetical protein ACRD2P_16915 [Terriglobia bacterium]